MKNQNTTLLIIFYLLADSIISLSSINLKKQSNSFTMVFKTTNYESGITLSTTNLPKFDRRVIALLL